MLLDVGSESCGSRARSIFPDRIWMLTTLERLLRSVVREAMVSDAHVSCSVEIC